MAPTAPFSIRGAQFKMVTLQLKDGAPDVIIPALQRLLEQSPAFLRGSPVVLGLDDVPPLEFYASAEECALKGNSKKTLKCTP